MSHQHDNQHAQSDGPRMPGHDIAMRSGSSHIWRPIRPWASGALWAVAAIIALVVASTTTGFDTLLAVLVFAACTFVVFRHIAAGGPPQTLLPRFVPASTGAAFALGGLFGLIAIVSTVVAAGAHAGNTQSIALLVAILAVLLIFVLISQAWDNRAR